MHYARSLLRELPSFHFERGRSPVGCKYSVNRDVIKKLHTWQLHFSFAGSPGHGQGKGGFLWAEESIKPSPVSDHDLGDHCVKLSGNPFRLKSTFSWLAAHRESTDLEKDKKQSQKNKETKKAFTFAFRGWTAPYSLEVIIHRTVNRGISNKRKTVVVTPVGYSHAKGEICVLTDELPILDHRRW